MNNLPMAQYRQFESQIHRWTRIGVFVLGAFILVLGGGAAAYRSKSAGLQGELAALRPQLENIQSQVESANQVKNHPVRTAYERIQDLQKELSQAVSYRGCTVTTFQVAGEPTAYADQGSKLASTTHLTQGSVRFEISGRTLDVIAAIRQVGTGEVPFEFDSLSFRRGKIREDGVDVIATAAIRVVGEVPGGTTS